MYIFNLFTPPPPGGDDAPRFCTNVRFDSWDASSGTILQQLQGFEKSMSSAIFGLAHRAALLGYSIAIPEVSYFISWFTFSLGNGTMSFTGFSMAHGH